MSSFQKVILLGRLGKDVEFKTIQSGNSVASFSVATSEQWKDKSGNKQEHTEWHNVTVWGPQAQNCHKYLQKGSMVLVEGQLKTESYEKDGEKRWSTKIIAKNVRFVSSKSQASDQPPQPPSPPDPLDNIPW